MTQEEWPQTLWGCCGVSSGTRLRAVTTLGRWTNGAEDSGTLLGRRQWIAVESFEA